MDKSELRQQIADMRQNLLDKGILNDYFLVVESLEESQPNFVENIIGTFLSQTDLCLDELHQTLETEPLNVKMVECLIQRLKGGSASMGAGEFNGIVEELWNVFKTQKIDRFDTALEEVKAGYANLRLQLEPYAKLLHLVREDAATDEASEVVAQDDGESVGSNDVNE